jgi:hypothetical protein
MLAAMYTKPATGGSLRANSRRSATEITHVFDLVGAISKVTLDHPESNTLSLLQFGKSQDL